ncbi:MAG: Leucine-tRNA ligase, partial [Parcubacteria group bacterium GW2011_GWA2_47_7]
HKFLYDIGAVSYPEPFLRLQNVGLIMADDGRKMSKRYGNVINPDDIVLQFGADSLRLYEMFMGPFGQSIAWSTDNLIGARRFIERVWKLQEKVVDTAPEDKAIELLRHQTIKKVTEDIECFAFNTAISQMMIYVNLLEKQSAIHSDIFAELIVLLAPFTPFMSEELWSMSGHTDSVHLAAWPTFDAKKTISDDMTIAVQVNGKLRDTFTVLRHTNEDAIRALALERDLVKKWIDEKEVKKIIYVREKLVNIVL